MEHPKCTHCGYEFDEEEMWHGDYTVGTVHKGDCDVSKLTCPSMDCGKIFHVRCEHHYTFVNVDEDEDDL